VQTSNTENGAEDEGLRFYTDSDGTMSLSGASSVTDAEMDALKEEWSAGCVQRTISNVAYMRWRFQAKMADNPNLSLIVTSLAASVAYLYLMMLRFPMLEPTVNASRLSPVFHKPIPGVALNWKSFMVISFQIGYFLGKIPAVCLTSKLKPWSRLRSMIFVSVFSFVTMVAFFSLLPAMFEGVMLCLGAMVMASLFGIISQYLEGRQFTEIMVSFLSLTLMLGRPLADLLARMMSEKHVAPEKIPPIIGVMFLPICLLAMFVLDTVPPPTARDAGRRAERRPISYRVGWKFVNEYSFGILLTVISYTVICAFRNYREYFASDIYSHTLNRDLNSWHYVALEFPAAAIVFICISLLARIKNNRFAFFMIIGIVSFGAILIVVVTYMYQNAMLSSDKVTAGFIWIECIATGTYLMYIPTGFLLFDRLIACTDFAGTVVFLINSADVFGQLGSLAVVLYHDLQTNPQDSAHYHQFYVDMIYPLLSLVLILNLLIFSYFFVKLDPEKYKKRQKPKGTIGPPAILNIQGDYVESEESESLIPSEASRSRRSSEFRSKRSNVVSRCDNMVTTKPKLRKRLSKASVETDGIDIAAETGVRSRRATPLSRRHSSSNDIDAREPERDLLMVGSLDELWHQCPECHHRFTEGQALRIHIRDTHLSVAVWINEPFQVKLKIQNLAHDPRNFTKALPYDKQFTEFDFELFKKSAKVTMQQQNSLALMFRNCVPSIVTEHMFWHNYAFRVKCIIEAFHSDNNYKYWTDFVSMEAYTQYMHDTLVNTELATQVMAIEKVADVIPGEIGVFVSNDAPYDPPAQIRFDRLGVRFVKWHQLEIIK